MCRNLEQYKSNEIKFKGILKDLIYKRAVNKSLRFIFTDLSTRIIASMIEKIGKPMHS